MTQSTEKLEGKGFADRILELYELGGSDAEVAASLRVPIKKFYDQIKKSPAFAELVEFGRTLSLAYWEGLARKNVGNKQFNSPLFAFYMKNRHGWSDKAEITSTAENTNYNIDDLRNQLSVLAAKYVKENTPETTDAQRVLRGLSNE